MIEKTMIEKMKEQDCDKGISRKKGNNLFYKMIISRKCLGIFFWIYGTVQLCGFAARAELLSSPPSMGSQILLLLSICFPFVYGTYLLCTKDRNHTETH